MGFAGDALNTLIESQIFFPQAHFDFFPEQFGLEYEDVWVTTSDGVRIHGWFFPAAMTKALFLFYHGNAGNISHRLDNIQRLHNIGLTVFIIDYRGYGRSEGRISEKGLYLDAEAVFAKAQERAQAAGMKLVVFGRSLGGIAAVHACCGKPCAGLILESTFPNLGAMAKAHFPLPLLHKGLEDRFNALGEISGVNAPILFFHGDRDDIVPIEFGRTLYEAAPEPKDFVTLAGAGHNDTYFVAGEAYFRKLKSFIDGLPEKTNE